MSAATGVISAHESYSRDEFLRRTGIGDWAFRAAKRSGLRTTKVGNRLFVRGADWNNFLEKITPNDNAARPGTNHSRTASE